LIAAPVFGKVRSMERRIPRWRRKYQAAWVLALLLTVCVPPTGLCEAPAAAAAGFNLYVSRVELRLVAQHRSIGSFLASRGSSTETDARLRRGDFIIEQLTPDGDLRGGLLHHWRGTAFVPGATAADFERLTKNLNAYPQRFSPQVAQAQIFTPYSGRIPDHFQGYLRVRQRHVITVVMDTTYDITYGRLDAQHGYSIARSTEISEISSPGTAKEHAMNEREEHGFLWRLNTYWSYEERDGGLYMQIESISLTRGIPAGLAWAIRPYLESVPRESLEFTLRSTCNALKK